MSEMGFKQGVFVVAAVVLCGCGAGEDTGSADAGVNAAKVVINEVVPANANGCADEKGEKDDWVELFNPGTKDVSLEGYSITDDPQIPLKKKLGAGLVVPAGGVLVLWADDAPDQGAAHLPFKLKASAEQVLLYDPAQTLLDEFHWSQAPDDVSYARFPDGTGAFSVCATPSCAAKNGAACGQ